MPTATHCKTLQRIAAHCNTLQHTALYTCISAAHPALYVSEVILYVGSPYTATYCDTLQHTANTLQNTAPHCTTLQHTALYTFILSTHTALHASEVILYVGSSCTAIQFETLQHTATHDTLQHTANTLQTHCNTPLCMAACCPNCSVCIEGVTVCRQLIHYNTPQHNATHCDFTTLHHVATHCFA